MRAYLGLEEGEVFIQPAPEAPPLVCNGSQVRSSQWLRDGDVVELDDAELRVEADGDALRLRLVPRLVEAAALPPADGAGAGSGAAAEREIRIRPVSFEPSPLAGPGRRRRLVPRAATLVGGVLLAALAAAGWLVLTAEPVRVEVAPEPDLLRIEGALWTPQLAGRFLLRPGEYTVVAERAGYRPLRAPLAVPADSTNPARFELEPLPGRLTIRVEPAGAEARVAIDGEDRGPVASEGLELAAGVHEVTIAADGFRPETRRVEIERPGALVELEVALVESRAPVTFTSESAEVAVVLAGRRLGTTPLTAPIAAGSHTVEWLRAGFKPARSRLTVEAGVPATLAAPALVPADGNLVVSTEPAGAAVTVDGVFRGRTPLELDLAPGREHEVRFSKEGYEPAARRIELAAGASDVLAVELPERTVRLRVSSRPPGAEVVIDGELRGTTGPEGLTVELAGAGPHSVEVRKEGYLVHRSQVTPRPGLDQSLEIELRTAEQVQLERTPPVIRTAEGQELRLVRPPAGGVRFRMGAPRREPGRRPNEVEREVELVRPFYLAVAEVSNESFRRFDLGHLSGAVGAVSLELDDHPAVRLSWAAAARYCNWLSDKDGLPPAYALRDGELRPVTPMNTGYRLPTEAEWEWVARYPEPPTVRKYPWGDALPIPPLAGNFGDLSAAPLLGRTLPDYNDGYPATAPVASLDPNPLGFLHLGGNVAEWMTDRYADDPRAGDGVERDPLGPADGGRYVIRGSSWTTNTVTALRLSVREAGSDGRPDVGFRIARYAE